MTRVGCNTGRITVFTRAKCVSKSDIGEKSLRLMSRGKDQCCLSWRPRPCHHLGHHFGNPRMIAHTLRDTSNTHACMSYLLYSDEIASLLSEPVSTFALSFTDDCFGCGYGCGASGFTVGGTADPQKTTEPGSVLGLNRLSLFLGERNHDYRSCA
jgi:hypothetical protein